MHIANHKSTGTEPVADYPPLFRQFIVWGIPLIFGLLGLAIGKVASWDFLNYHWYNPYALLHGRLDMDMAVAHHATFYNPLLDVPFYLAARSLPAWLAGFLLATAQGFNFSLLYLLAHVLLPIDNARQRFAAAVAVALAGMGGAGAFGLLGDSTGDNLASLGVLAMLVALVRQWPLMVAGSPRQAMTVGAAAGLLGGIAAGSKLTMAVYVLGFGSVLLILPGRWTRRLLLLTAFGMGAALGFAVTAGPWMLHLWHVTGNPLFPYFNDLFHSPLLAESSYRDTRFLPQTLTDRLLFPLLFSLNSRRVAEYYFRDFHIGVLYLLTPPAILAPLFFKSRDVKEKDQLQTFLLIGGLLSYLLWLQLFAIYRYLIVLEMLSPLLIVLALSRLARSQRSLLLVSVTVLLVCQLAVSVKTNRLPWKGRFVEVKVPEISNPANTMVLMTGLKPMAYVIPSFPHQIPFIRIQGYLAGPSKNENQYVREMRRRVGAFRGDLFVLFHPWEEEKSTEALNAFGLRRVDDRCRAVTSNIGPTLSFCPVVPLEAQYLSKGEGQGLDGGKH